MSSYPGKAGQLAVPDFPPPASPPMPPGVIEGYVYHAPDGHNMGRGELTVTRDHIVRIRVEEELRAERALATWYEDHPTIHWDDLQAEHRARLVLLERLSRG